MKQDIVIPRMGESITEATIGNIIKASGSKVAADDEILELETDKVNQALYAPVAGVVTLNVKPQDVVKIGQVIGFVDSEGAETAAPPKEEKKAPAPPPKKQEGESIRQLKEDFKVEEEPKSAPKSVVVSGSRGESRQKMTKIRKVIATRLVEAQQTTAMLTTFNEIDLAQVMAIREKYKESFQKEHGAKLGFMSFFVKAAVSALKAVPDLNSYIDGDEIVRREYFDIGVAVGTDKGVIVPVIRNCDQLNFAQIEEQIESFATRAKEGKLSVDDLQGAGFTITNGGTYGSLLSTPILTPPQCGILGMHKIMKRPVAINDQVVIRPMMYVALTYDHRIVDGKEAVTFLVHLKNCLEDPSRLLLEV